MFFFSFIFSPHACVTWVNFNLYTCHTTVLYLFVFVLDIRPVSFISIHVYWSILGNARIFYIHMFWSISISIYIYTLYDSCILYIFVFYIQMNYIYCSTVCFFVIICIIIFYWWIIEFIFYLNTIGTPIAGPFQLNKSWGICPEFTQWLLGAELKPLGYWLLYHCLLTASKPWIWKGCMSLTSGSYITLFCG